MRSCLCFLAFALISFAADSHPGQPLRGRLVVRDGQPPAMETSDRQTVLLEGDETTRKVLADTRLNGFEAEARGHFTAPGRFLIDASHTHSLLARKDGKLKLITYWCDLCSIRAYTPGPCVCCREETTLSLIDPDSP
jgi:hypothetical protein